MQAEEVLVGETRFAKGGSRVCGVLGSLLLAAIAPSRYSRTDQTFSVRPE